MDCVFSSSLNARALALFLLMCRFRIERRHYSPDATLCFERTEFQRPFAISILPISRFIRLYALRVQRASQFNMFGSAPSQYGGVFDALYGAAVPTSQVLQSNASMQPAHAAF
jgi:hypothetical protein